MSRIREPVCIPYKNKMASRVVAFSRAGSREIAQKIFNPLFNPFTRNEPDFLADFRLQGRETSFPGERHKFDAVCDAVNTDLDRTTRIRAQRRGPRTSKIAGKTDFSSVTN